MIFITLYNTNTYHCLISVSEQETWADAVNRIVQRSQTERNKSCQLRTTAESLINKVAQEMWHTWSNTNNALAHRSSELLEAKNKLTQHLQKVSKLMRVFFSD